MISQKKFVNRLKFFLISTVLIIFIAIFYYILINSNKKIRHESNKSDSGENNILLKVNNPSLLGINLKHGTYSIEAVETTERNSGTDFIKPSVKMLLNHKDKVNISSNRAFLTPNKDILELYEDITSNYNEQYYFKSNFVRFIKEKNIIESDEKIQINDTHENLTSENGFSYNYETEIANFKGKIYIQIKEQNKDTTQVFADLLDIYRLENKAVLSGDVNVLKNGARIEANKMIIINEPNKNKIETIKAYGNVRIKDNEKTATSDYAEYNVSNSIVTLRENVCLYKDGSVLKGEYLQYDLIDKKAELLGAKQNNKRVAATLIPNQKK